MAIKRVEKEIVLNLESQYEPCMENLNLMIDFLYGGSFVGFAYSRRKRKTKAKRGK